MNDYYECNFQGIKPHSGTDSETTKRFILDKYIKKKWVDTDSEDPVKLYRAGQWGKEAKKEKKGKKKPKKQVKEESSSESESEE
jgi:hypothetical protein